MSTLYNNNAAQNPYITSLPHGTMISANPQDYIYNTGFKLDVNRFPLEELYTLRADIDKRIDYLESTTRQIGPTRNEMDKHESLKSAWEEYLVVRKLIGLPK
jgi:hypothetical protein